MTYSTLERWFGVFETADQEAPVYHLMDESFMSGYAERHPEANVFEAVPE